MIFLFLLNFGSLLAFFAPYRGRSPYTSRYDYHTRSRSGQVCPTLTREKLEEFRWRNRENILQQEVIFRGDKLKECRDNKIAYFPNGGIPSITQTGFYVSPILRRFDASKNYIGMVIFAIKDRDTWFNDGEKQTYRIRSYSNNRVYTSYIKPGYIIMEESENLDKYPGSMHSRLLHHFFGKSATQLKNEGKQFVAVGFSYQATDTKTNEVKCSYKWKSGTYNAGAYLDFVTALPGNDGTTRSIDTELENLIQHAIDDFRVTGRRLSRISDMYSAMHLPFPKCEAEPKPTPRPTPRPQPSD